MFLHDQLMVILNANDRVSPLTGRKSWIRRKQRYYFFYVIYNVESYYDLHQFMKIILPNLH
jgi:hypothetical protein